jgi:hypothetical protein
MYRSHTMNTVNGQLGPHQKERTVQYFRFQGEKKYLHFLKNPLVKIIFAEEKTQMFKSPSQRPKAVENGPNTAYCPA